MYKQIIYALTMTAILLTQGKGYAVEQLVSIEVPFAFQVNDKALAAGKYVIKRDPQMPRVLMIHSRERNEAMMVNAQPLELTGKPSRAALVFKDYGEQRFLSEVRVASGNVKYALFPSPVESKLAQIAKAKVVSALPNSH